MSYWQAREALARSMQQVDLEASLNSRTPFVFSRTRTGEPDDEFDDRPRYVRVVCAESMQ